MVIGGGVGLECSQLADTKTTARIYNRTLVGAENALRENSGLGYVRIA